MGRPVIIKNYSLVGVGEGWTDECQFRYTAVTYADTKEVQGWDREKLGDDQIAQLMIGFIQKHFVSGMGLSLSKNNELQVAPLSKEDVAELPLQVLSDIFIEMLGSKLDPKGMNPAAQNGPLLPQSDEPTGN